MAHYLLGKNETYLNNARNWGSHFKWETCNYPNTLNTRWVKEFSRPIPFTNDIRLSTITFFLISTHRCSSAANDYLNTQSYMQMSSIDDNKSYIQTSIKILDIVVNRPQVDDYW